jgi:hypothetical protein
LLSRSSNALFLFVTHALHTYIDCCRVENLSKLFPFFSFSLAFVLASVIGAVALCFSFC